MKNENDLSNHYFFTDGKTILLLMGVWSRAVQTGTNTIIMLCKMVLLLLLVHWYVQTGRNTRNYAVLQTGTGACTGLETCTINA